MTFPPLRTSEHVQRSRAAIRARLFHKTMQVRKPELSGKQRKGGNGITELLGAQNGEALLPEVLFAGVTDVHSVEDCCVTFQQGLLGSQGLRVVWIRLIMR